MSILSPLDRLISYRTNERGFLYKRKQWFNVSLDRPSILDNYVVLFGLSNTINHSGVILTVKL